jgi:hypothetical protein
LLAATFTTLAAATATTTTAATAAAIATTLIRSAYVLARCVSITSRIVLATGVHFGRLRSSRTLLAALTTAISTTLMALMTVRTAVITRSLRTTLELKAIGAHLAHIEELGGHRVRQPQRVAIVEVNASSAGFACTHGHHGVLAAQATPHLDGIFFARREVQEAATAAAQTVTTRAFGIGARHAYIDGLGRFARLTGLDRNRVAIERTHLVVAHFVAATVAGVDSGLHISSLNRLAQLFSKRMDDLTQIRPAVLVDAQVELLGLVAQHVSERASDAFDEILIRHGESLKRAAHRRRQGRGLGLRSRAPPGWACGESG